MNKFMLRRLSEKGFAIIATYYGPSMEDGHPAGKPKPGMFLKAQRKHMIDMAGSFAVGDKETDIVAAMRAGVGTTVLNYPRPRDRNEIRASFVVKDLWDVDR